MTVSRRVMGREPSEDRRPAVARGAAIAAGVAVLTLWAFGATRAQVPAALNGPPAQVTPYAAEPGVPIITITPGTLAPPPIGDAGSGSGTGTGDTGSGGAGDNSNVLNTMLGTSWGNTAIANAQAVGLNPTALAATCVMESGCGANLGSGGAQGVFQMFPAAYQEGLQTALAANPQLTSQVVQGSAGMNDPTTEAIAASGYLMQANQALEADNISNPTVLQARSYYEFGPTYGPAVATANGSTALSTIVPANFLSNNNISATTTVAQWQASVAAKLGNAAGQSIMM